jgi:hypothetical protein
MVFKILPDGLVVLFAATEIKGGDVLDDAFYGAVGDGVILNSSFNDSDIQSLDIFPSACAGLSFPVAGINDKLTILGADLFCTPR